MIGESNDGVELVDMRDESTTNTENANLPDKDAVIVEGETLNNNPRPGGNSTKAGAYFNFVNSIVGAGVIGLPFAINECGFFFGFFLLLLVGWLTYAGVQTLINCGEELQVDNYEALCEETMGRSGFYIASFFMFTFAFGAMCAYMIIIGDTMPHVILLTLGISISRQLTILILAVFVILPLALLKDMSKLSKTSSVSVFAALCIVIFVAFRGPSLAREDYAAEKNVSLGTVLSVADADYSFIKASFPAGLGAISFAYVCQHSSFIVFNTLKVRTKHEWRIVSKYSIGTAMFLSILICLGGFLTFFDETKPDILNNYSEKDAGVNFARFLLALTMLFTYPMEQFVARHSLNAMIWDSPMSNLRHYSMSLVLWGTSLIIGLAVDDLGFVLELTGAFSASMLGYILPATVHFKIHPIGPSWTAVKRTCFVKDSDEYKESNLLDRISKFNNFSCMVFLFVFGWVAMITGTITAIVSLTYDDE